MEALLSEQRGLVVGKIDGPTNSVGGIYQRKKNEFAECERCWWWRNEDYPRRRSDRHTIYYVQFCDNRGQTQRWTRCNGAESAKETGVRLLMHKCIIFVVFPTPFDRSFS